MCCPALGVLVWGTAFAGEAECPCRVLGPASPVLHLGPAFILPPFPPVRLPWKGLSRPRREPTFHSAWAAGSTLPRGWKGSEPLSAARGRQPGSRPMHFGTWRGKHPSRGSASLHAGSGWHRALPSPRGLTAYRIRPWRICSHVPFTRATEVC